MPTLRRLAPLVLLLLTAAPAHAATPPVLRTEVPAGHGTTVDQAPAHDPARRVDGRTGDWTGTLPGFGGASIYAHGELVYEDHVFDAYGADNGQDAQRMAVQDPATAAVPELYRLDPAYQYVPGEFGIPTGPLTTTTHYGDDAHADEADLSELRLGTDETGALWVLARTTTMKDDKPGSALLLLLDTKPGDTPRDVPFNSALHTTKGDVAVLLIGDRGWYADLAGNQVHALPKGSVATDAGGYRNAIEARLPAALVGAHPNVAAGAGLADGDKLKTLDYQANLANVAFRGDEPARDWWDKRQGLELQKQTIDAFFTAADLRRMRDGETERYVPGPGYHDRIFSSAPKISTEKGEEGVLQHYGVYLPSSYRTGRRTPLQLWMHFRGGNAHIAAAAVPGIFEDMGERQNTIVVTPRGRGEDKWYVGKSQADFREVWDDVHRLLLVDRDRTYVAGHSMGGWASYLLPILYPDRFAATFPASGPPTQGLWAGCEQDACFSGANGGRAREEWTTPLLDNLRGVPVAIYQGAADELVPVSGVVMQAKALQDLGLRYRLYLFPHEEHYGPPVVDQWSEGAAYEHQFVRDPNPSQVTYTRSMPFERAVDEVNADGATFDWHFDRAYWMSGLEPTDSKKGVARFDGRSLAIPAPAHTLVPEASGPATADQSGPYTMTGQAWKDTPGSAAPPRNAFTAALTGARGVELDLGRMSLSTRRAISGDVTTEAAAILRLRGDLPATTTATIDGKRATLTRSAPGVVALAVPAGRHAVELTPAR